MPANLTPEYLKADREYKAARTSEEKLVCLERMLSVIPKHKGTDKLQADLKHRIARLKNAVEAQARKKGPSFRVRPEGAGQIMLVGGPNTGKSTLLAALTHATPVIGDYPCTTREPMPGMAQYQNVSIQLVDLPPVWSEHCESFVFDNIRACDGALALVDLGADDPAEGFVQTLELLREKHIELTAPIPAREENQTGAVQIESCLVLNKADLDPSGELAALVREVIDTPLPWRVISAKERLGLDELRQAMFDLLHVIRIYPKEPGKPPDLLAPFTMASGSTILDFAIRVHRDFADRLKSARVWGSAKFDGQEVHRNHVLKDGDVVELLL